jgi:cytochrome o ubiquinol oxidase subunit 2
MKKRNLFFISFLPLCAVTFAFIVSRFENVVIWNPKGLIALKERNLIILIVSIMLIVVIPVFISVFYVFWKYRQENTKSNYAPNWTGNIFSKIIIWAIPTVVIIALSLITWKAAHELDPYKPIESSTKPITIQVVALRWKWLFIYPEQNIASVNFVQFPINTPINLLLTADEAPMNSFWIPSLSGQIYAMQSMETKLHLIANNFGDFSGEAAEINGSGLSGMRFTARVGTKDEFENWIKLTKKSSNLLTLDVYNQLLKPSENNKSVFYSSVDKNLYDNIIMKYMYPKNGVGEMKMKEN